MKRVVAFFDIYDEVPTNATYLYSRRVDVPIEETEEQKNARIISDNPEIHASAPVVFYMHYYEVEQMDFDELVESDFFKKQPTEKVKEFLHKHKIEK